MHSTIYEYWIPEAIGPHDVLSTLLNNLKVQERQLRICTTAPLLIVLGWYADYASQP